MQALERTKKPTNDRILNQTLGRVCHQNRSPSMRHSPHPHLHPHRVWRLGLFDEALNVAI